MSEHNKLLMRRAVEEIWNQGNYAVLNELVASDFVIHNPGGDIRGPEGAKEFFTLLHVAFPDIHFTIEDQVAAGDRVVTRWRASGTHKGDFQGIPPTGKQVTITAIDIDRIAGGKVVECWASMDELGLLHQLGAVALPAQTDEKEGAHSMSTERNSISAYSTINGIQLFWERTGKTGEPLVLVHGSWVDHHNWDAVVPFLARSYSVLTYDRRGHSRSERPASQGSVQEDVADLAALIEEQGMAPAHIIVHSFGGSIVLRLAAQRPDLFQSLTIHEPPLFGLLAEEPEGQEMLETIKARIDVVVEQLKAGEMEAGVRPFVETIAFGEGAWVQMPEHTRHTAIFNAPTFLDETYDPDALTIDLTGLQGFSRPALLTLGGQSPAFFESVLQKVARQLPRGERHLFATAGHEPEQSHPATYAVALTTFLRGAAGKQTENGKARKDGN